MEKIYFTVAGTNHYFGNDFLKPDMKVRLTKEPDNDYDMEAIACENKYIGKTGYIANSTRTVTKGTMSAGRIYDKIGDISYCEVKFVSDDSVIAKVLSNDTIEELKKENEEDTFFNPQLE